MCKLSWLLTDFWSSELSVCLSVWHQYKIEMSDMYITASAISRFLWGSVPLNNQVGQIKSALPNKHPIHPRDADMTQNYIFKACCQMHVNLSSH